MAEAWKAYSVRDGEWRERCTVYGSGRDTAVFSTNLLLQLATMDGTYSIEDIMDFLNGERGEEETRSFWEAAELDERLRMDVEACKKLIEEGRRKRFQAFLKEVKDFDAGLPPVGEE